MRWTPGISRAKLAIAEHGRTIAVVLAVVGLLALTGAGWVYTNPPTTTVTEQSHEQTIESSLDTSAVVTGDSALYDSGERIENQPVYFTETMPDLTLTAEAAVPADQSVRVDQQVALVMQAARDGEVFWERSRLLIDEETTTTTGATTASATVDVPELRERLAPVADEVGTAGTLSVTVELTTAYETDRYSGTLTRQRPLDLADRTYALEPFAVENRESTTETRTTTLPRSNLAYGAPAAVGALALLSAVVLFGLYRLRGEAWSGLETQIHRDRYAEWISVGSLRGEVGERSIAMASVEDLVDVAIDQEKRVVFDPEIHTHAVIDGSVVYYHGPVDPRHDQCDSADVDDATTGDGTGDMSTTDGAAGDGAS